jgi:hypothetical protein
MMKLAKSRLPDKIERQLWVYAELDRMYPPLPTPDTDCPDSDSEKVQIG